MGQDEIDKSAAMSPDIEKDSEAEQLKEIIGQQKAIIAKLNESKKKDLWDRVASLSGLFTFLSSIVIAMIGIHFTNAYKAQEVRISEAQTVEKFMPYLTGANENAKRGAILAVASLSNKELAARLGALSASSGTIDALELIFKTAEGEGKELLKDSLIDAYFNRGLDLLNSNQDMDRVISDYNRIHELAKDDEISSKRGVYFLCHSYMNRGSAYREKGNYDQALEDYKRALQIRSEEGLVYQNIALTYDYKGDFAASIANHEKSIKYSNTEAAYTARGTSYERKGEFDKAIADYTTGISINPNIYYPYYNRALAYKKKGEFDKAASDFRKAITLINNPKDQEWRKKAESEIEEIGQKIKAQENNRPKSSVGRGSR